MIRSEEHKRARLNVEVGVCQALEARKRAEEEHTWLEAEEEARLVEEARRACSSLSVILLLFLSFQPCLFNEACLLFSL